VEVPYYLGPWQYLARAVLVQRAIRAAYDPQDAIILRASSHIAGLLEPYASGSGHPYGVEVVNDPFDAFAPGTVRSRLRPLFRWLFTKQLMRQCRRACGVAYVTRTVLQKRYPCRQYSVGTSDVDITPDTILPAPNVYSTHYSSIELAKEDAVATHRRPVPRRAFRLITVASLAQMYKAPDVLLNAVARCIAAGFDIQLTLVGDGKHRPEMERLAAQLGIASRVRFAGQLPAGVAVRTALDGSDLFVLPSRSEGLPRAMIEAMARALPCIGTAVGGIPELLPAEDLVGPDDAAGLADKIQEVLSSPSRMARMSARNLEIAQDYREDVLAPRRKAFFEHVREATEAWLAVRHRPALVAAADTQGL
jgi:glycosyltransferase involved in cell wall biosynthesis